MRRFTIAIAVFVLLLVAITSAQQAPTTSVPNLIRYGGMLKDAQGAPIASSTLGTTFAIYKQQDGGAPIWMETQNVTTDVAGNYSVLLGSTTATGLPGDLFSQQEQRWLGVEVQGQTEQPRVLMVSVPYAFKAHEAETLGGRSVSDFVLATGTSSSSNSTTTVQAAPASGNNPTGSGSTSAASAGPTNFSGSTTDQIVGVTQSGTGYAIAATADSKAIVGTATDPSATAYGVQGVATGTAGVGLIGTASSTTGFTYGLRGTSSSTSGTGVRGIAVATSGSTVGISGYVDSAAGTAGVLNNAAGGNILVGQNNGTAKFTVDGSGNVNALGTFTGNGSGLTGIQFSQLAGNLASAQLSGTYTQALTLSNTANVYYGNGSNLTGVLPAAGSPNYIQNNNSSPQTNASFNIDGSGTVGQSFSANAVNSATTYQIGGGGQSSAVLSIGNNPNNDNLFLGIGAGGNYPQSGTQNTFSGFQAGNGNNGGSQNTFSGYQAGYNTTTGGANAFYGLQAGYSNTIGKNNTFAGDKAGYNNTTGKSNLYVANQGPTSGTESNTIRIGTQGTDLGEQNVAYIAGIYSATTNSGSPVFVDSTGMLGTGGGSGLVTSFNGRAGAVVPAANDYSFSLLSGKLGDSQLSGTYANALTLSNTSNSFTGSGAGLSNVNAAQLGGLAASAFAQLAISNTFQGNVNMEGDTRVDFSGLNSGSFTPGIRFGSGNTGEAIASDRVGSVNKDGIDLYTSHTARLSITNGGSVGIGTATPQAMLDVNGSINSTTVYQIGGNTAVSIGGANDENLFLGVAAGSNNVAGAGTGNAFSGTYAGYSNTTGYNNTFSGALAGYSNTTADANVFFGALAGYSNTTGYVDTFIGPLAGYNNVTGNSDIYIANEGPSSGTESNTIRIGAQGNGESQQDVTFIAGIYGATSSGGVSVYVNSSGRLGTQTSSLRFKEQVRDLGDTTNALMKLRPVSFLYKPEYADGDRTLQYGLIAEEVAQVYPELVAYDKDGQPYTVRYQYLAPMLLNEVQKQYRRAEQQSEIVASQQAQIRAQQHEIEGLKQQLQLQNASLQERLSRLEKLADSQAQMVARK